MAYLLSSSALGARQVYVGVRLSFMNADCVTAPERTVAALNVAVVRFCGMLRILMPLQVAPAVLPSDLMNDALILIQLLTQIDGCVDP